MSEDGGKLLNLADHPNYRKSSQDPETTEEPTEAQMEAIAQQCEEEFDREDREEAEIAAAVDLIRAGNEWGEKGLPLATCQDCEHRVDTRSKWRQILGASPALADLRCSLKENSRCEYLNPNGDCNEFISA